jgi:hypothetical protein
MRSTVFFLCTLPLLTFFLSMENTCAQDRDARVAKLREDERSLERARDQLKDEIKKVETNDASGRSSHVVIRANYGFGATTYAVVPRDVFDTRSAVQILTGVATLKQQLEMNRTVMGITKAFPNVAREELRLIEAALADVKNELLPLLKTPRAQGGENDLATNIDLSGAWNVTAKGNNGLSYTATLRLTRGADGAYSGSFDWRSATHSGEEKITGRLDPATRTLTLNGVVASGNISSASYRIEVSEGGRSLDNGTWTGSDGGGRWNAGK